LGELERLVCILFHRPYCFYIKTIVKLSSRQQIFYRFSKKVVIFDGNGFKALRGKYLRSIRNAKSATFRHGRAPVIRSSSAMYPTERQHIARI
jgi:hypothetical protein